MAGSSGDWPTSGSTCPPSAGRCTRAQSRVCTARGVSGVRTRPIDPCRWRRHPCRASLALFEVGSSSIGIASTSTAGGLRCSSAAPPESGETPDPALDPSSTTCAEAPMPPQNVSCGNLASTARLHPAVQVSEVVAVAAPHRRGDLRRRGPRRRAFSCCVVSVAGRTLVGRPGETTEQVMASGPRPSAARPARSPSPGGELARARASTNINCYGHRGRKTLADGCG